MNHGNEWKCAERTAGPIGCSGDICPGFQKDCCILGIGGEPWLFSFIAIILCFLLVLDTHFIPPLINFISPHWQANAAVLARLPGQPQLLGNTQLSIIHSRSLTDEERECQSRSVKKWGGGNWWGQRMSKKWLKSKGRGGGVGVLCGEAAAAIPERPSFHLYLVVTWTRVTCSYTLIVLLKGDLIYYWFSLGGF